MKISKLIVKKLRGEISTDEDSFLEQWRFQSTDNDNLFKRLKKLHEKGIDISEIDNIQDPNTAWKKVNQEYEINKSSLNKKPIEVWKYVAIFALILSVGYSAYTSFKYNAPISKIDSNAITLQLDNGEIQILSLDNNKNITDDKGVILGKKDGAKLDYSNAGVEEKLVYNKLTIPYGKKFEISLSDGTTVHLNSGSSIRYPVKFLKGKKRQVYLEGEAFFDVSKDKEHPFIVTTSDMDVTVLGTEFNVSAYPEDKFINTVLVEGSVSLSDVNDIEKENNIILQPGYKAEWNVANKNTIFNKVDTDIYTGWIQGKLVIKNLPFSSIISRLERHYNIKIINNYSELNKEMFTASFDVETIEEVLDSFAENIEFTFEAKNNVITINKN
ncbi:FecR family protein [uncultured Maribacter sp.]|uniref:FecR family protein n=1 Tax=uncultured Maribacter sp. TaxID=431308 RepID=UPI002636D20A|nr:FecR family protein [uncultured Maribacter sp.]